MVRVLLIHNRYRLPGGEDVCVQAQAKLLRERGHEVRVFEKDNREIDSYGLLRKVNLYFKTAENPAAALEIAREAKEFQPQVAIVHNTLPLLSPSIYAPLKAAGAKVIQYLHNYRLVCPAGTLYRDGAPCSLCVDDTLKHAAKYNCWTGSKFATLALTRMLDHHRRARTWQTKVDLFVALNAFMRDVVVKKGVVPADRIVVQPNFVEVPQASGSENGAEFLFLGRLTAEKGVMTIAKAAELAPEIRVRILGDGPIGADVRAAAGKQPNFLVPGHVPREEALKQLANCRALIFSSLWPEGCPGVIQEAFALGKPVIASRVAGAMELVSDGETGLLFDPGNAEQLAACMKKLRDDPELAARMGKAAREKYERDFSPEAGYRRMSENFSRLGV
jgi:glycosyltransferase involved in cell wall biosynthesis